MTATLIAILSGAVGAILAALGAYLKGRKDGAARHAQRAAEGHIETRSRMDAEDRIDDDLGAIRERLRKRGER